MLLSKETEWVTLLVCDTLGVVGRLEWIKEAWIEVCLSDGAIENETGERSEKWVVAADLLLD